MPNPTPPSRDELLAELSAACAGLLYPSESDEPFDAFVWSATESDAVKQLAGLGRQSRCLWKLRWMRSSRN